MTNFKLVPFGAGKFPTVSGAIKRSNNQLHVEWHVKPLKQPIVWPPEEGALQRQDELWKSTCFEIFVSASEPETSAKTYFEINISPSGRWQCYRFDDYRQGQSVSDSLQLLKLNTVHNAEHCSLSCIVEYSLPHFVTTSLDISISAILQNRPDTTLDTTLDANTSKTVTLDGDTQGHNNLQYFALRHPADRPDFHLANSRLLKMSLQE